MIGRAAPRFSSSTQPRPATVRTQLGADVTYALPRARSFLRANMRAVSSSVAAAAAAVGEFHAREAAAAIFTAGCWRALRQTGGARQTVAHETDAAGIRQHARQAGRNAGKGTLVIGEAAPVAAVGAGRALVADDLASARVRAAFAVIVVAAAAVAHLARRCTIEGRVVDRGLRPAVPCRTASVPLKLAHAAKLTAPTTASDEPMRTCLRKVTLRSIGDAGFSSSAWNPENVLRCGAPALRYGPGGG